MRNTIPTMDETPTGRGRGPLDAETYATVRRSTETYREELIVRLCGEVGLRPAEVVAVEPRHVREVGDDAHLLAVPETSGGDGGGDAYLPPDVAHALAQYVGANDVADDERIVHLTPRRVQMIVSAVTDRAADRTGVEAVGEVSTRDFREYFARRLLVDERVDPRVVMAVGGFDGVDSLLAGLRAPDRDEVVAAFEPPATGAGGAADAPDDALGRAGRQAGAGLLVTGADGTVEQVNRRFAELVGEEPASLAGRPASELYADGEFRRPEGDDARVGRARLGSDGDGNGDGRVVHQTVTRLSDDRGNRDGFVATVVPASEDGDPDRLARLGDVLSAFHRLTEVLVSASTRAEVERGVCERLAASEAYRFAWFGEPSGDGTVTPGARSGFDVDGNPVEDVVGRGGGEREQIERALDTGAVTVAEHAPADDDDADTYRVAAVPIVYGETTQGVVTVGTDDPRDFDERERVLLADLGQRIGQSITGIERQKLLLADSVLELEFRSTDRASVFVDASARFGCSFRLEGIVPDQDRSLLYFVTMEGAAPDEVLDLAAGTPTVEDARLVRDYGEGYLLEFIVTGDEPAVTLAEHGGKIAELVVSDGAERLVAEFTPGTDVRGVVRGLESSFDDAHLLSKQETERPVQTTAGFRRTLEDELTDRQQAVLRAAYFAGYFEWPRRSTAEELADSVGVSSPTLHNPLRKAQQKLLTVFFHETPD